MAMCGGLVINFARGGKLLSFYHLGRLLSYSLLGAAAGGIGAGVPTTLLSPTVSSIASVAFALLLVAIGFRKLKGIPFHFRLPALVSDTVGLAVRSVMRRQQSGFNALSLGFLSALLPCGWLYTFVLAATATRDPLLGAGSLSLFWLGTAPALSFFPSIANQLASKFGVNAPRVSGVIMIGLGFVSLGLHTSSLVSAAKTSTHEACPMHSR